MRGKLLAVDPGGVHVGVALFVEVTEGEWYCEEAFETSPEGFIVLLEGLLSEGVLEFVVFERFILETHRASKIAGSEMEVSQLIGVIKYLVERIGNSVQLIGQTNKVKRPALAWASAHHYSFLAARSRAGGHAKDAELHGVYAIVRHLRNTLI